MSRSTSINDLRRTVFTVLVLAWASTPASIAEPGDGAFVYSELIYTEAPFPSCHASTIVETSGGVLVAAWFGGTDEGEDDVGIWVSRSTGGNRATEDATRAGSGRWSAPVEVANGLVEGDRHPTWNPVLFQPRRADGSPGPLLLFFKVGPSPSRWWGEVMHSDDDGATWSSPRKLGDGLIGPVRAKPVQLRSRVILAGSSTEHDGWRLHFESSDDLGRSWRLGEAIHDGTDFGAIQPTFLTHEDGRIQALARSRQNRIVETWSSDDGRTWAPPTATELPNPSAGVDALTLPDGRHLLVYNHTSRLEGETPPDGTRSFLNLAVSDDGVSWAAAMVLENQPGEYSYPAMIRAHDGRVHVTYTFQRRRIKHVVLDPERLTSRAIVSGRWPEGVELAPAN